MKEEAAKFYASLFPNSHVDAVHRAPSDYPSGKTGDVLLAPVTLPRARARAPAPCRVIDPDPTFIRARFK